MSTIVIVSEILAPRASLCISSLCISFLLQSWYGIHSFFFHQVNWYKKYDVYTQPYPIISSKISDTVEHHVSWNTSRTKKHMLHVLYRVWELNLKKWPLQSSRDTGIWRVWIKTGNSNVVWFMDFEQYADISSRRIWVWGMGTLRKTLQFLFCYFKAILKWKK